MAPTDSNVAMADIAAAADVAVSTVSRALSGAPGVSAQKREEILAIARRLGYLGSPASAPSPAGPPASAPRPAGRPSAIAPRSAWPTAPATSPPVAPPARITAVVPESDRWVFGSILAGIHDVLGPLDASLRVKQGLSASARASFLAGPNLADETDLVILVPAPRDFSAQALNALPVPVVIAGTVVEGVASVGIDDVAVGHMATNYLRNVGLTSIAYVSRLDPRARKCCNGVHPTAWCHALDRTFVPRPHSCSFGGSAPPPTTAAAPTASRLTTSTPVRVPVFVRGG